MAKQPSQDEFLGGRVTFNQVGHVPAGAEPESAPARPTARGSRPLLILAIVLLLALLIFAAFQEGLSGVIHTGGHGTAPASGPPQPDRNF